ncbi:MAG: hypothetical protein IJ346_05550 [Clostridia bacterium]|nr:hypothetical protein [Clostridia bacterium]
MDNKINLLKEKLVKAEAKKASAEAEIKDLKAKIEQAEISAIQAAMKEYSVPYSELVELIKNRKNIEDVVSDNET